VTDNRLRSSSFETLHPSLLARLVVAAADVAMVVDTGGVVRDVAFGGEAGLAETFDSVVGKPWLETISPDSRSKATALLSEAAANDDARPREINHSIPRAPDGVPIRYSAMRLSGSNEILVVGRDLRGVAAMEQRLSSTQQAMEREYGRLRASETRYRMLFNVSSEAVLIADAGTRRISEVNPAAALLFAEPQRLLGKPVQQLFHQESQDDLLALFAQAATSSHGAAGLCKRAPDGAPVTVSVNLFRQDGASHLLLRANGSAVSEMRASAPERGRLPDQIIEHLPDAFVATTADGMILSANNAFIDLTQLATLQQLEAQPIDRWLGRAGVDFTALRSMLATSGMVRNFKTVFRGSYGLVQDVEVSAVAVRTTGLFHGFLLRQRPAEVELEARLRDDLPRSVHQMTELVGSVPLKELVRQTTDIIERLCIEAALQLTGDNRASAADLLGLSRQSLYAKLHRYGIADTDRVEN
jgi:transcriptional regulator PpsR